MKKFEAKTLEEVYELASNNFACSIVELEVKIIQQPTKGFLGIGKKNAIIAVKRKKTKKRDYTHLKEQRFRKKDIKIEDIFKKIKNSSKENKKETYKNEKEKGKSKKVSQDQPKEKIFDNFYNKSNYNKKINKIVVKKDKEAILSEVKKDLNSLFGEICYEIDDIKVEFYDEETLYVQFTGKDSALLIGKEGYRYKALSYILFNWLNEKYGLMIRLEVAQFLKNQEEAIDAYLIPIIKNIKEKGSFKTKPLDGILIHIALKKLRCEFPEKYVAIKTNIKGDKYVLVNEYKNKE